MLPATQCPDEKLLEAALLGLSPDSESDVVERHLVECPECLARTRNMAASDTFVELLKRQQSLAPDAALPAFADELMERLKTLSSSDVATHISAMDGTNSGDPAHEPAAREYLDQFAPAEAPDELGRLAGFRILKLLGKGGMGAVFLAEDVQLRRPVALKIMHSAFASQQHAGERFLREARAAAAIKHDHVVTIYQVGQERGVPFLAQELLTGEMLDDALRRQPLGLAETLRIGREIALGLAAAHGRGLLHRDIKPSNIWLENGRRRAKILDFGLARSRETDAELTGTGMILGTPAYMAPEQAMGEKVDDRCDLFSLGCVLYRMTTGRLPFLGKDAFSVLRSLALDTPPAPRSLNPELPQAFSDFIERLLSKDREQRPASAESVAETLLEFSQAAVAAPVSGVFSGAATVSLGATGGLSAGASAAPPGHRGLKKIWLAAAGSAAVLLLCGFILIKITSKDGTVTKIKVPEGSDIEISSTLQPDPPKAANQKAVVAPSRRAVLAGGPPLSIRALVPRPAAIPGLKSWSVELVGPQTAATSIAASAKDDLVATGNAFGKISLWDEKGKLERQLLGHDGWIFSLDFSADGRRLASCDLKTARVWNVATGAVEASISLPEWGRHCVAISSDGEQLAASTPQGGCQVLDVRTGRTRTASVGSLSAGLAWSPDGRQIAGSCEDNELRVWDAATLNVARQAPCPNSPTVAWSPDGRWLAVANAQAGTVVIRHAETLKIEKEFPAAPSIHNLIWLADSRRLAAGSSGIYEAATGKQLAKFDSAGPVALRRNDAEAALFYGGEGGGKLRFFNTATGGMLREGPDRGNIDSMWAMLSAEGRDVYLTTHTHLMVHDAATGEQRHRFDLAAGTEHWTVRPQPEGPLAALHAWSRDSVRFYDGRTGARQLALDHGKSIVASVEWSPDGKRLATGADDKLIRIWNPTSGKVEWELAGHTGAVRSLAWSADGSRLASAALDKTVRVWNPSTGKLVATFDQFPEEIPAIERGHGHSIAWAEDGKRLWILLQANIVPLDVETGLFGVKENFSHGNIVGALFPSRDGSRMLIRDNANWTFFRGRDAVDRRLLGDKLGAAVQWHPDNRRFVGWEHTTTGTIAFDVDRNRRLGILFHQISGDNWLCIGPDGSYRGSPKIDEHVVYVALHDDGAQRTYTPQAFREKFGWKNDPTQARFLELAPGDEAPASSSATKKEVAVAQKPAPVAKPGWQGWPAESPPPAIAPFDAVQAKKHQEAWAKYLKVPVEYTNTIGMKFVLIPPGEFTMGSTPAETEANLKEVELNDKHGRACIQSEVPKHKVILTQPIYLGIHEVTQKDYEAVTGKNPSFFAKTGTIPEYVAKVAGLETASHPVECVNWTDAAEFCVKLSRKEELKPFYFRAGEMPTALDGTGYRLPTEAEWEFACRAGTPTKYWTGDYELELTEAAWFGTNVGTNSGHRTHAVGELKANPFGLYDIHGNVWEWVQDWWEPNYYGERQGKPFINPSGSSSAGSLRVFKGGGWARTASTCRAARRTASGPEARQADLGFRVTLVAAAVQQALKKGQATSSVTPVPIHVDPSKVLPGKPLTPLSTENPVWPADAPPPAIAPFDAGQAKKHQAAWANHLKVDVEVTNSLGMKFRLIPPGEFLMGLSETEYDDLEKRAAQHAGWFAPNLPYQLHHRRTRLIQPVYCGTTEVTRAEFQKFVETTKYRTEVEAPGKEGEQNGAQQEGKTPDITWRTPGFADPAADLPVTMVSPRDAIAFCKWLSERDQITYRLPREDEWEFAVRGGSVLRYVASVDPRQILDALRDTPRGNFPADRPLPVARKPENAFGIFDGVGNVGEWCSRVRGYDRGPLIPSLQLSTQPGHALRGSDYSQSTEQGFFVDVGARIVVNHYSHMTDNLHGFRVVRELPPGPARPAIALPPTPASLTKQSFVSRPEPIPGIRSWSLELRALNHTQVGQVAISRDGDWVALAGTGANGIRVFLYDRNLALQKVLCGIDGSDWFVSSFAFSPDGKRLAAAGPGAILTWNVSTGRLEDPKYLTGDWFFLGEALAWSPDSRRLAFSAGGNGSSLRILDVATGMITKSTDRRPWRFTALAWEPNGKRIAWASNGGTPAVELFDAESLKTSLEIPLGTAVNAVAWSPDGKQLAATGAGQTWVWAAETKSVRKLAEVGGNSVAWSPNGEQVATFGGVSHIIDVKTGKRREQITLNSGIGGWSPDGETVYSHHARGDGLGLYQLRAYDARTFELKAATSDMGNVAFAPAVLAPDGKTLLTGGNAGEWCFWDAETGEMTRRLRAQGERFDYSPNGRWLSVPQEKEMLLLDAETGGNQRHLPSKQGAILRWAWSADSRFLAMQPTEQPKSVEIWDVEKEKRIWQVEHSEPVDELAWSPDKPWLATLVGHTRVTFWNAETGRKLHDPWSRQKVGGDAGAAESIRALAWNRQDSTLTLMFLAPYLPPTLTFRSLNPAMNEAADVFADNITPFPGGGDNYFAWSPRDQSLAFPDAMNRNSVVFQARTKTKSVFPWWSHNLQWHPDGRRLLGLPPTGWSPISGYDTQRRQLLGTLMPRFDDDESWLCIGPTGHYRGSPNIEKHIVYVALHDDDSQVTYAPAEFQKKFGWKNDPDKATLFQLAPADETPLGLQTADPPASKETIGTGARKPGSSENPGWHGWPTDSPPPAVAPFDAEQAKKYQVAWAKHLKVPVEYTNSIGMKFRLIPPGEFLMGDTPAEVEEELKILSVIQSSEEGIKHSQEQLKSGLPQHKVILTQPIYLGVHEVTQAQYAKVMGNNPSNFNAAGQGADSLKESVAGLDTSAHPVDTVNWHMAAEFCTKLSEDEKLKAFYVRAGNRRMEKIGLRTATPLKGGGYRLPTEAEWEFSCRAGTTTRYWIGDSDEDLPRAGWFAMNSGNRTHPVGELKANPFGLYDVHGNISESVDDWYEPEYYGQFQEKPAIDPQGPSPSRSEVTRRADVDRPANNNIRPPGMSFANFWRTEHPFRGGDYAHDALPCRASFRRTGPMHHITGFRVVLTVGVAR